MQILGWRKGWKKRPWKRHNVSQWVEWNDIIEQSDEDVVEPGSGSVPNANNDVEVEQKDEDAM